MEFSIKNSVEAVALGDKSRCMTRTDRRSELKQVRDDEVSKDLGDEGASHPFRGARDFSRLAR